MAFALRQLDTHLDRFVAAARFVFEAADEDVRGAIDPAGGHLPSEEREEDRDVRLAFQVDDLASEGELLVLLDLLQELRLVHGARLPRMTLVPGSL